MNMLRLIRSVAASFALLLALTVSPLERAEVAGQKLSPASVFAPSVPQIHGPLHEPLHPIFGDVRVRQALYQCMDIEALIGSFHPPTITPSELVRDSFLAPNHWAYSAPPEPFEFDPVAAAELLEEAGWVLPPGETVRVAQGALYAEEGTNLSFDLTVLDSPARRTWVPVLVEQWREHCNVEADVTYAPASVLLDNDEAGSLFHRDFEVAIFPWTTGSNPPVDLFYSCDAIPSAENEYEGFNFSGWCSPELVMLMDQVRDTPGASLAERIAFYQSIQEHSYIDVPSVPLWSSAYFYGVNGSLENFDPQPVDQALWNIDTWALPNQETAVVRLSQEPANLLTDRSLVVANIAGAIHDRPVATNEYVAAAHALTQLPTAANGGVQKQTGNVQEGDVVFNSDGDRSTLLPGVEVQLADGSVVVYQGGVVSMNHIVVNYAFKEDIRWSDGTEVSAVDYQLAYDAICSPSPLVVNTAFCDAVDQVVFADTGYTVTLLPGVRVSDFSTPPFTFLPAHQIIQSPGEHQGKELADVPFEDWFMLNEVMDTSLTTGPYQPVLWIHGERMELSANPFYRLGPPNFDQIIIRFDMTNQEAFQGLVDGTVHVADGIGGSNTPSVVVHAGPSSTWEHIDFNLELYDYTASVEISPSIGGKVMNPLGGILTVPPDAFNSDATVSINHLARPSQSLSDIGTPIQIFDVTLTDSSGQLISTTLQPLELTFVYSPTHVSGLNEQTFNIVKLDDNTWELLLPCNGCSVNPAENQATVRTIELGEFALVGRAQIYTPLLRKE